MQKQPDTNQDDWDAQLADYMFGVMDSEAALKFERRLTQCSEHVEAVQGYNQIAGWLALAVPPADPPEGHKTRLMSRLTATPQSFGEGPETPQEAVASAPPARLVAQAPTKKLEPATPADLGQYREKRRGGSFLPVFATVAAAMVLLLGGWGWMSAMRVGNLEREIAGRIDRINIPPGYVAFPVVGQGDTQANAVVLFNPDTNQASLLANGLTPLPADKVYELWLLPQPSSNQKPLAAGVFKADELGHAHHQAVVPSRLKDYVGVAVTIEDAPGRQEPSQQPILAGSW